jgi:tetratricopeptide (TPR) repeat protein
MKYVLTFLLAILGLSLVAQPTVDPGSTNPIIAKFEVAKVFQQGKTYYQSGQFDMAIVQFNRVLNLDRSYPRVYEMRGEAYFKLGSYQQAVQDYSKAIRRSPLNAELYNSAGVAAAKLTRYPMALWYFEQALAIDPSHEGASRNVRSLRRYYRGDPLPMPDPPGETKTGPKVSEDNIFDPTKKEPQPISILNLRAYNLDGSRSDEPIDNAPREKKDRIFDDMQSAYRYVADREQIKVGRQSDPYLEIRRIIVRENSTEVTFMLRNVSSESYPLLLSERGVKEAFYITDPALNRKIRLRELRSLQRRSGGKGLTLAPGQQKPFVAIFEALPPDMYHFHLLEGTENIAGAFNFWNITLKD